MAITTSSTLTQEFVDILSAELLLAPDMQYVFASLADMAKMGAMELPPTDGSQGVRGYAGAMGQGVGTIDRMGGYKPQSGGDVYKEFLRYVFEPVNPGKQVLMDKPTLLGGTYTLASRTLTEGTRITANPIALAESQVAIPIVELGGPYDNGQTAVAPIGISDFLKRRARHEQIERVAVELRRDYNKVVDTILIALALSTSNQTIGSSGAGGGTTTGMTTDGNPLTDADVRNIKKDLISRNIPTFANGRYLLCLSPQHEVDLAADAAFREIVRYPRVGDGGGPLLSGYLGAYGGFDIVTSNNIPTVAVGSGGAVTGIQAIAMGPNALAWANGMDAMARMDKNDDFQRENRYVWLAEHGFALLDANMVQKVVTS